MIVRFSVVQHFVRADHEDLEVHSAQPEVLQRRSCQLHQGVQPQRLAGIRHSCGRVRKWCLAPGTLCAEFRSWFTAEAFMMIPLKKMVRTRR